VQGPWKRHSRSMLRNHEQAPAMSKDRLHRVPTIQGVGVG
jgi:hypothetical protein